ncbi:MAG TPA: DMT family transporter, partial [Anaerolineae bacterium]|nr:DMT family transporter [Anaerolineae bacterium]
AALLTSVFFSFTAVIFAQTSRRVGSMITNRVRLVIALIYLMIINLLLFGQPLPIGAGIERWVWLSLSGIIGLALGDMFLFSTYEHIGPRLGMLLLSLAPIISALLAWLFFGETLRLGQIAGIALTLSGIIWVVSTRPAENSNQPHIDGRGLLFGVLAATGQAVGLVLSKQGMAGDFSPFAGNAIRMLAAMVAFWLITFVQRQGRETIVAVRRDRSALKLIAIGAFIGPVLGVSASLLAVQHAEVGVASTLMALPPIFLLPISYFVYKERFGWQTVAGTFVAIAGVALLFLV